MKSQTEIEKEIEMTSTKNRLESELFPIWRAISILAKEIDKLRIRLKEKELKELK